MKRYRFTEQLQSTYESLQMPFAIYQFIHKQVVTIALSDGFCELFGYEDKAQAYYDMDHDMYKDTHPDDMARIADAAFRFATEGGKFEVIYRTSTKNGTGYKIVHALGRHVYTEDGVRLAHIWYTDEGTYAEEPRGDESELQRAMNNALHEESLVKSSSFDFLTGLPAMTLFFERADALKEAILDKGGQPALLYVDFCGMKFFNANHGFAEGDKMLLSFARILSRAFGSENCCRIGADHFAAAIEEAGLEDKLDGIFHAFGELYGGKTPPVHVGIYPQRMEDVPVSVACDRAKLACSSLIGSYTSSYRYFNTRLRDEAMRKQYIVENFDTAVREKWIEIYLQPIIRAVNEKICDVEALARWNDPEKGVLPPDSFIPALEEAGLIYKLDLYMVDRVVELIQTQKADGFTVIPHSINLSRADFDACDIVEEIRKRVDTAGVDHSLITIEITESVIGGDVDFIKKEVERFRSLGFPVWMDDFGSGYSSVDVLQCIRFDLIKFDMSFMRKLEPGDEGKIILTELMRMVTSLNMDTVCEGVETEAQVRFLREIGCSKLQGYYYSKPLPYDVIRKMYSSNTLNENENPEEAAYYENVGRVNLFDIGVITGEERDMLQNNFATIPIAVLEVRDGVPRYLRHNRSYPDFVKRYFGISITNGQWANTQVSDGYLSACFSAVKQCCETGNPVFFDDRMPDGSLVHAFARRVDVNPVTGSAAVAVAVLSITAPDDKTTYADIAKSLAADYYNIYVIDLDSDTYIEYITQVGGEELAIQRRGRGFFESAGRDAMIRIYEEDREPFLKRFTRENVLQEIDAQGVFTTTYRLIDTGTPVYVSMKISRLQGGNRLILGISIIDAQMKKQEEEKKLRQESVSLGRIAALAGNYIALYIVDPVTEQFFKYSSSAEYAQLGLAEQGDAFFDQVITDGEKVLYPEDRERILYILTKDNVLRGIRQNGLFVHNYRLLIEGRYVPVSLRATLLREDSGEKILFGVNRLFSKEPSTNESETIFTHIAQALAREYTDLYYVNIDTDEFVEFQTDSSLGILTEARRGADFFEECRRDVRLFVHPEDRDAFVSTMDPDFLRNKLGKSKEHKLIYRRIKNGRSFYVRMNISRFEDDPSLLVMAVSDVDELMKKRQSEERIMEERIIYARLHALNGNFIVVYVVDPETGRYREFSANDHYEEIFAQAKEGTEFFATLRSAVRVFSHPKDTERVLALLTQENVMEEIGRSGIFTLGYRILMEGKYVYFQLKAATVEEKEGTRLIVGLNNIDAQVRQQEEYGRKLAKAQREASLDALTGVKNKHAYTVTERALNRQIKMHRQAPFAVVVFDVNNLKTVNDSFGHQAGDHYLCESCKTICEIFKRSPVFRIGGDEFAVISQGSDYDRVEELIGKVNEHNAEAVQNDGIVIACGMAKYENDANVAAVFERADQNMYENKSRLKAGL